MKMLKILIISICLGVLVSQESHLLRSINHNEFILSINEKSQTWTAGKNERFENMKLNDVKRLLGALKTPEEFKLPEKDIQILETLPENFDLRQRWPTCESLQVVRDQSGCGSCWAFGAGEAMSDRICIASKGELQIKISTNYILSCCTSCGFGCDGGYPAEAWDFWQRNGVPTGGLYNDEETCQPYAFPPCDHHVDKESYGPCGSYKTPKCENNCQAKYSKNSFKNDLWYAESAYSVANNEQKIMTEIYNNGSVEVAFSVYEDFLNYKSGVYQHVTGNELGGHAVKMIGWGIENGVKYWLIVNSWNTNWGDKGTFKILRGKNHCGIEDEVVAGMARLKKEAQKNIR